MAEIKLGDIPLRAMAGYAVGACIGYAVGTPIVVTAGSVAATLIVRDLFNMAGEKLSESLKDIDKEENLKYAINAFGTGMPIVALQYVLEVLTRLGAAVQTAAILTATFYFIGKFAKPRIMLLLPEQIKQYLPNNDTGVKPKQL